jgi:hypothetical protein
MPDAHDSWTPLPHGPIEELAENLLRVEGSLPDMPLPRAMTAACLPDGRLVLHNGVALSDEARLALERRGEPAFLIVPNGWHRLDAKAFKERYPKLRVYCPKAATKSVSAVVPVDGDYDALPALPGVELRHLAGVKEREGVLAVRSEDGLTLVFNDLLFNIDRLSGFFWGTVYGKLMGSTGGLRVPRAMRLFMIKDRRALREELFSRATAELKRIVVGHGRVVDAAAGEALRGVAEAL